MNDIKRLLAVIPKNWPLFLRGVTQYSLWSFHGIFNAYMIGRIAGILENTPDNIVKILTVYGIILLFMNLFIWLTKNWGWPELLSGYQKVIHREYIEKFIYLDNDAVERVGTGKIISILEKGMSRRGFILSQGLNKFIVLVSTFLYVSYMFFTLGVWYLLGFLLFVFLIFCSSIYFNKKILKARKERVYAGNRYSKELVRIVMSKVEVMQHWNRDSEMKKLDAPQDDSIAANKNMNPAIHRFFWLPTLIVDGGRIILYFFVGYAIVQGIGSLPALVSLGVGIVYLDMVLDQTLFFYKDFTKNLDTVKVMREFFDNAAPKRDYNAGDDFTYDGDKIVFKNVDFGYNEAKIFNNFSLDITGSKKTALVGVSGSGKSTLVKLIAGYLETDGGSVLVDGVDLKTVKMTSYWQHIGFLSQEPNVFDGTIYDNLIYALGENVDEKLLEKALRDAQCNFVFDFKEGLYTEIGERGIRLSGGQRQRIAIAKVFLKNPSIIILDEPTSALDSFSEEAITEAMHILFEGRTVIIIAHRLQTVKNADDIIVLEEGKVIERGTHNQLVDEGGSYTKMLELQSGF